MLRPITDWKELQRKLRALKLKIFYCEECKHVWLSEEAPLRCPRRTCRAWANAPKYDSVGRPPAEADE